MDMMPKAALAALILTLLPLAACGGGTPRNSQTQNNIDALTNAANQSTPVAQEVLRNKAEEIEGQNIQAAPGDPNSPVQQALNEAGQKDRGAPPPLQAEPHKPGDPVPPPKSPPQP